MREIMFLKQDDLKYIEGKLKDRLRTNSVTLENGFILYHSKEPSCYLIVRDAKQRRHKIEALTEKFSHDGEGSLYPFKIRKIQEYGENFAFDAKKEAEIFEELVKGYSSGRIDDNRYFDGVQLLNRSRKELVEEVKQNYDRVTGIGAAVIGFLGAAALYKLSEYTRFNLQDYVDFWKFAIATGCITGFIRSSIPAISIDLDIKKKKNKLVKELTDLIKGEEPKTT